MDALERLKQALSRDIEISTNAYDLEAAAKDESGMTPVPPMAVVRPNNETQCLAVVRACLDLGYPMVPRGAGTGLEGAAIPVRNAVVIDLGLMDKVLDKSPADHFVSAQPGIIYDRLNYDLRHTGLFFPPSPGGSSDSATIGGMVATNASGIYAYRYGGTADWVRQLRVITGRGEVLDLGTRAPKSSTGYDLKAMFVGSEGTLGIITRIGLKLAPLPNARLRQAFSFDSLEDATGFAVEIAGALPYLAAVELMDRGTIRLVKDFLGMDIADGTYIFIEYHSPSTIPDDVTDLGASLAADFHGQNVDMKDPWHIRHFGTRAVTAKNKAIVRTDAAVPLSALADYIRHVVSYIPSRPVYAFGHAGIGIVHLLMPFDPDDPSDTAKAADFKRMAAMTAVRMQGTVSGEHGIGIGNRAFAIQQYGAALPYMKELKSIFDPQGLMNPGKVL